MLAAEPQLRSIDGTLAVGALCAAGSAFVARPLGWSCPLHTLTGWWCPFCGGTRCIESLAQGHLIVALRCNGLVVLVLAFLTARLALRLAGLTPDLRRLDRWLVRVDLRVWTAALVTWFVIRNLPWFSLLAPAAG